MKPESGPSVIRDNVESLANIALAGTILSFLGCLFIFLSYFKIKSLSKLPAFKMILHLAIADFLLTINGIVNVHAKDVDTKFCEVWGFVRTHVTLSTFLWPFAFAYSMHCFYTGKYTTQKHLRKSFKYYALLCWAGPLVLTIIPLLINGYGPGEFYCFLHSEDPKTTFYLGLFIFYLPTTLLIFLILIYYVKILKAIRANPTPKQDSSNHEMMNLFIYPVVIIIAHLFGAADRFINFDAKANIYWLAATHLFLRQAQGFFDAWIYSMSPRFRKQFKKFFSGKEGNRKLLKKDGNDSSFSDPSLIHISEVSFTSLPMKGCGR